MTGKSDSKKALITSAFLFACFWACLWCQAVWSSTDCPADKIDARKKVKTVYDGDTVRLQNGEVVRFIGINAPEIGRDGKPSDPFARKAQKRLHQLLKSQQMTLALRYGEQQRDRYDRLLAHAYLPDGRSINTILLREGLAAQVTIPPNLYNATCYSKAEKPATDQALRIWKTPRYQSNSVADLPENEGGFRVISGEVTRLSTRGKKYYLSLQNRLTLRVDQNDLRYFNRAFFDRLHGKQVVVRGWISTRGNTPQMRLRHPAQIEVK